MLDKLFNFLGINKKTIFINRGNEGCNINQTNIENLYLSSKDEFDDLTLPEILKSNLTESDKTNFVDIKGKDFLLDRFYFENEDNDLLNFFNENKNKLTLFEIIQNNNKGILLGNPGLGKTVELECLANDLWNNKELEYVPILRNLKNFTAVNTIENYINLKFRRFQKVIFILDGIDEITDIQDFTSKLESFVQKLEIEKKEFKILLSCRTNVYEKIVKGVNDFKVYYLKDLIYNQSIELLKNRCGDIIDSLNLDELDTSFLKSPFQVNILANYINDKKSLPTNNAELWKEYIESRFSIDENEKLKKITLDVTLINDYCKKVSLINELMQTNVFDEDNLFKIVKKNSSDFKEFKKNPLIQLQLGTKKWNFEHRNIQEYFASLSLSDLPLEDIISFIFVEKTNKSHPLLFNTITFLLNLLDDKTSKFESLVDFLVVNEPELLFKSDTDRISQEIRIRVFQKYFEDTCIDKRYWITTNRTFDVKEIAKFGDCEANFDYLIAIIENLEVLFRARISALNLISFFRNISTKKIDGFKSLIIRNLKSIDNTLQIKSAMLQAVAIMKICVSDEKYLDELLEIFEDETDKEINAELLNIIFEFDDIDRYSNYIKEEFLRANNLKLRKNPDEVIRSNSYVLNQLILKIKDSNIFIDFAKYYFDPDKNIDTYTSNENELIEKCLIFDSLDNHFIRKLFKDIGVQKPHFYFERNVRELLSRISKESSNIFFKYLLDNYDFKDVNFPLSQLINEENIWFVIDKFNISNVVDFKEIEFFRNRIANNQKRNIARLFNSEMKKKGFTFEEELFSDEQIVEINKKAEEKPQKNFDILFETEKLLEEIKQIFDKNGEEINHEKYYEINMEWYQVNGHSNVIDTSFEILRGLIYELNRPVLFDDVKKLFENEDFIFNEIKSDLQKDEKTKKINVKDSQKDDINAWITTKISEIDFEKVFVMDENGYLLLQDYYKWEAVVYFSRRLKFSLPKSFLLNSLIIPETLGYDEDKSWFDYFKESINNDSIFNARIVENLKGNIKLSTFVLDKHVNYALEKELKLIFPEIRRYLLKEGREYNFKNKLLIFHKLENDIELLKECSSDIYSFQAWDAISLLLEEKLEKHFCLDKAISYLDNIKDHNKNFISNALNVLFQLNSEKAIEYYYKFLNVDVYSHAYANYFVNYNVIGDYKILELFFDRIYLDNKFDRVLSNASNFLNQYIFNLSREDESYKKVQEVLVSIKEKLINDSNDRGIFQVNLLIDHSNNSYINSKSRPLSFNESLRKVNEILN